LTFFVDANIVVYSRVPSDFRDACLEILESIARGEVEGRTSTAVLEEVWYVEVSGKAGRLDGLTERAYTILTPLLPVTDDAFRLARSLDAPKLGPNDRLHAGTCLAHEIEVVVSADQGFDGVRGIRRVDPLDDRARRRLLRST
jgi:predicted nucleic acid-binding protein